MASFAITGNSSVSQTLASNETGYVAEGANLYSAGDAITITDDSYLTVLGSVAALTSNSIAVYGTSTSIHSFDAIVGASGRLPA